MRTPYRGLIGLGLVTTALTACGDPGMMTVVSGGLPPLPTPAPQSPQTRAPASANLIGPSGILPAQVPPVQAERVTPTAPPSGREVLASPADGGGGGGGAITVPVGGHIATPPPGPLDQHNLSTVVTNLPVMTVPAPPAGFTPGSKIALVSNKDGNSEIYLANPDGTAMQRLTTDPSDDLYPHFSPDRREIIWCSNQGHVFAIYRMWADGSHATRLTFGTLPATQPVYSPDGTKIAFVRWTGAGTSVISVMNRDGSGEIRLSPGGGQSYCPAWSPDSTQLVFGSNYVGGTIPVMYKMSASGGPVTPLTQLNGADYPIGAIRWSPDGTRIAFATNVANHGLGITLLNPDGTNRTELTHSNDIDPVWSQDGTRIMYASSGGHASQLMTMNANGTGGATVTPGSDSYAQPDW